MLDKNFDPKSFEKNFSFEIEASVRKPSADPLMILLRLLTSQDLCISDMPCATRYKTF